MTQDADYVCPHVCPKRPGKGHEWYLRKSDGLRFCRDCGYDWVEEKDTVGRSLGRRREADREC